MLRTYINLIRNDKGGIMFGVKLNTGQFPDSITSGNIVFHYTGQNYPILDHAKREAAYTKREGYYVRVIKRGERYGVYSAEKR